MMIKVGDYMIKQNRLNNGLYLATLLMALLIFFISGIYLWNNPLWDVKNWYVIAFSNSIITFVVIHTPCFLKRFFRWTFSPLMTLVFYAFVILTLIVGEAIGVYRITAFYDSFIHFLGGIVLSLTGYYVYMKLTKEKNMPLLIMFILGFQALFGTVWEIFEFGLDFMIKSNTQSYFDDVTQTLFIGQMALKDTMLDFIFNTLGSVLFVSVLPYIKSEWLETKS